MARVQVILDEKERELFRRMAEEEGLSLSAWLKKAGLEKVEQRRERRRLGSVAALRRFFAESRQREEGREPDWDDHLGVMEESRRAGRTST